MRSRKKSLSVIVGESERLTRLINDVLDLSKLEKGAAKLNCRRCSLKKVVEDVVNGMSTQAEEKGILLEVFGTETPFIWIDVDMVKQVLCNLISNAIKIYRSWRQGLNLFCCWRKCPIC